MPYSSDEFDGVISEIFIILDPNELIDLGAGAGKYGLMIRKIKPTVETIAIELENDYINRFDLTSIYTQVWNISAMDLLHGKYYETKFDTIMIGDLIEHLRKSDGIDLLNFLVYRCRWMIIQFPHHYLQNSVDGYLSEAHISIWAESDFLPFERTEMYKKNSQRLLVIKGYLEEKISIDKIESVLERNVF